MEETNETGILEFVISDHFTIFLRTARLQKSETSNLNIL